MSSWLDQLRAEAADRERASLDRRLVEVDRCSKFIRVDGCEMLNLAGNDYLALASHPRVIEGIGLSFGTSESSK